MKEISDRRSEVSESPVLRLFFFTLGAWLLALCCSASAQQSGKIPRIGLLMSSSTAEATPFIDAFRQGLRELGYVEGKNIVLEIRGGEASPNRLSEIAAELVQLKVDIIVAGASLAVRAAKEATATIPIVMRFGSDPVRDGLVASLARPGGNITGVASLNLGLIGKRFELLAEVVPGTRRIAVLLARNLVPFMATDEYKEMAAAARGFGVKLQVLTALDPNAIDNAFLATTTEHAQALIVIPSPRFFEHRELIIKHAAKNRLPSIYPQGVFVEDGGLMSYAPDFADEYRRLTIYVDKILKGAKPADLPVEQPTKFELVINLRTAKQIGLAFRPLY